MSKQIKDFIVGDLIGRDGRNSVYEATQVMAGGITRPAALKLLHGWNTDDPTDVEHLTEEVTLMIEVGAAPHVLTVYDFGVDEEMGPWIAMERAQGNLNAELGEDPADPRSVRLLLRQMLEALAVLHAVDPPIVHRDVKPRNILRVAGNAWALSDFSLATRGESQKTMSLLTVKYAAPELLDSALGRETPAVDLYALGFSVYEYALGQALFRRQLPSIYDPHAETPAEHSKDDRSKWMYWHSSLQMTAAPLQDVLPRFPEDISSVVEGLMTKPLDRRLRAATDALEKLSDTSAIEFAAPAARAKAKAKATKSSLVPLRTIGLAVVALVLVAGLLLYMVPNLLFKTELKLDRERFEGNRPFIQVRGTVENLPRGGEAVVAVRDAGTFAASFDGTGRFRAEAEAPRLGDNEAEVIVRDRRGRKVASRFVDLERLPPERVEVKLVTRPVVAGAAVKIRAADEAGAPKRYETAEDGVATADVKYGSFELMIEHPAYEALEGTIRTGYDPVKEVTANLVRLSDDRLKAKAAALDEQIGAVDDQIAALDSEIEELRRRAAAGDPEAKRLLEQKLKEREALIKKREALVAERQKLTDAAGPALAEPGDAKAAGPKRPLTRAERKAQLEDRLRELAKRVAAGDPEALAEYLEVQNELRRLEEGGPKSEAQIKRELEDRRAQIERRMAELRERAAAGDPAAIAELKRLEREKQILDAMARGEITAAQAQELIRAVTGADRIDEKALLSLPLTYLKIFVQENVPTGALRIEPIVALDRLRISGPVFSDAEYGRLRLRLAAAHKRLQLEVRIDPGELADKLAATLEATGFADVRVHPFLSDPVQQSLLVQFTDDGRGDRPKGARLAAEDFVVDSDLIQVQGIREAEE